jgi:hypothetical protein
MPSMVRIAYGGAGVVLPCSAPYDRELLFDYVAQSVRRHGGVRIEHGSSIWTVRAADDGGTACCSECEKPLAGLMFRQALQVFCHACARRLLAGASRPAPPPYTASTRPQPTPRRRGRGVWRGTNLAAVSAGRRRD